MSEKRNEGDLSITSLIFVPFLISLAVTVLRLVGELQHWPSVLFKNGAGGVGSIVGITWLAPIFGIYFAIRLNSAGKGPAGKGRAIGFAILGLVVAFAGGTLLRPGSAVKQAMAYPIIAIGTLIPLLGWRDLFKILLAYGYSARVPVLILMYFAFQGAWGTHYDAVPPGFPATTFFTKFLELAILPQMILWIAFTILMGSLFGSISILLVRSRQVTQPA
ncbi:MAG TPA: hypothetical protein VJX67_13120 [Blastocatellia bacterium]|nr:hypothetical protein [Blastocatellia bacterium]